MNSWFSSFFKKPTASIKLDVPDLTLQLSPESATSKAHKSAPIYFFQGQTADSANQKVNLTDKNAKIIQVRPGDEMQIPFGMWTIEIIEPWWLAGKSAVVLNLFPQQKKLFGLNELFQGQIVYYEVSPSDQARALALDNLKVLILPQVRRIPVLKSSEIKWLSQ